MYQFAGIEKRMSQVAQGLEYIRSEGVVHGDIRGANILLDDNLQVQIADFGLTHVLEATSPVRSGTLAGDPIESGEQSETVVQCARSRRYDG
ncbi:hypothetical protein F5887DRAFT_272263 [Amanita rubescens]|nr:hypothetical protein F5887DRAFT_272263 [Amanita rubescens]